MHVSISLRGRLRIVAMEPFSEMQDDTATAATSP